MKSAWSAALFAAVVGLVPMVGCETVSHDHSPATRPAVATDVDPSHGEPDYWLNQTPALSVGDAKFDVLWDAAQRVSQDYLFAIDRRDKREGLLTTVPLVSAQWFEPWRRELQNTKDVVDSSVATVRRTIQWQFRQVSNGWAVTPKVLIEREVLTEERISGVLNRAYFKRDPTDNIYGTRETDENVLLPASYWYPTGRDFEFEQLLIEKMHRRLDAVAMR